MKKILFSVTGFCFLVFLFSFQFSISSCKKVIHEIKEVHDTVILSVHDTLLNYDPLAQHINDSLWAYYPFNNDILDKSGHNRTLSPKNGLGLAPDMWGNDNSCLKFDGINDYAVIDDGRNFPEGDFTVAVKFTCPTLNGRIFQKADITNAKGASFGLGFAYPGGQFLHYSISRDLNVCSAFSDGNTLDLLRTPNLASDSWYHVVIVHKAGTQKLYLNGKLVSSQKTALSTFKNCAAGTFNLGIWWLNDTNHFTGKMDDIRIYTRGLKDDEIAYLSKCSMQ